MPWPTLDPGKMVHQITILHLVASSDISGSTVTWQPLLSTYGEIEPISGREQIDAGQTTTQLMLTVRIYWQSGILPNMRVQSRTGTYYIQSIENTGERNVLLVLNCLGLGANQ